MISQGYLEGVRVCALLEDLGKINELVSCLAALKKAEEGQTKLADGDVTSAIILATEAEKIFSNIPEAKYLQAICKADISAAYGRLRDYNNSIKNAKECIELVKGNRQFVTTEGAANLNIGNSLANLGMRSEAISYLKKARELYACSAGSEKYLSVIENNIEFLLEGGRDSLSNDDLPQQPNSNCFIATVVYGDENSPEVILLRHFRDEKLSSTIVGKMVIKLYYAGFGYQLSRIILKKMNWTIPFIRKIIDRLVLQIK